MKKEDKVYFNDFIRLVARRMKEQEQEQVLLEPFKIFDHDGRSYISEA